MPFDAKCPECGEKFKLLDKERGQRFRCEGCAHVFVPGKTRDDTEDIDEPAPRKKSAISSELAERGAGGYWSPNKKDRDEPSKRGGSRRIRKPSNESGSTVIIVGVIGFFVLSAIGVGIWVAVQDRTPEPEIAQGPFNQGNVVFPNPGDFAPPPNFGGPGGPGGFFPPEVNPVAPRVEIKDLDSDTLLAQITGPGRQWDRAETFAELARRKELRAIGPIAKRLPDFFDRGHAENALKVYGALAEKEMLTYFNHPDDGTRDTARRLLKEYKTAQDLLVTQSLKDLKSANGNVQRNALGWIGEQTPIADRAVEVASIQEKLLTSADNQVRDVAMKGLLKWGSKQNTPGVATMLEARAKEVFPGDGHRAAFEALGKWKDARSAAALILYLPNHFTTGDAGKALEQLAPEAAKDVVKLMNSPNPTVQTRVRALLKGYGAADELLLAQSLDDLKAKDANQRRTAVEWLENTKPIEAKRSETAKALAALLKDRDGWTQEAAARALKVWLDKEAVPELLAVLNAKAGGGLSRNLHNLAMEMLGTLKDERAIPALVARLPDFFDRPAASKALKDFGAPAEDEVVKLLIHRDVHLRMEVCGILQVIGTEKSVPALETLASGQVGDGSIRAAKTALDAIKKKLKPE